MGKPITQAMGEVNKTINFCQYYSKNFEPILPTLIKSDAKKKTLIKYNPLGVIYYIVPFNFPFYLNFKGGLPNLLLGNCLLMRNADSTPYLGELIEKLMIQAGYDSG
jgi:succinate-semialdehyde dehydrogenase/glutarate-semialdehyde dehydrogenase